MQRCFLNTEHVKFGNAFVVASRLEQQQLSTTNRDNTLNGCRWAEHKRGDSASALGGAFLDTSFAAVRNGGLLRVTCTNIACLAGTHVGKCFTMNASIPWHSRWGHEFGLGLRSQHLRRTPPATTSTSRYSSASTRTSLSDYVQARCSTSSRGCPHSTRLSSSQEGRAGASSLTCS